jgi:hypothetical protein
MAAAPGSGAVLRHCRGRMRDSLGPRPCLCGDLGTLPGRCRAKVALALGPSRVGGVAEARGALAWSPAARAPLHSSHSAWMARHLAFDLRALCGRSPSAPTGAEPRFSARLAGPQRPAAMVRGNKQLTASEPLSVRCRRMVQVAVLFLFEYLLRGREGGQGGGRRRPSREQRRMALRRRLSSRAATLVQPGTGRKGGGILGICRALMDVFAAAEAGHDPCRAPCWRAA